MTVTGPPSGDTAVFSRALKERSRDLHRRAERSPYLRALMTGELDRQGYAALVAQEWFVYVALEEAAARLHNDPVVAPFLDNELSRVTGLEADLSHLLGPDWRTGLRPGSATTRYVGRIREVAATWPSGFIAHHYTRYLGDLSGGQAIAAVVARTYGFNDGAGIRSYAFTGITDKTAFKQAYRAKLDAAPWTGAEGERVIDEVLLAYRLNAEVLDELAAGLSLPVRS